MSGYLDYLLQDVRQMVKSLTILIEETTSLVENLAERVRNDGKDR